MDEQAYVESKFGILDHVPIGIFVLRKDYTILFWNRCLEQWTKIARDAIVGRNFDDCFSTLQKPLLRIRLESVFEGGPPTIFSSQLHAYLLPVTTRAGKIRFQHTIVSAVRSADQSSFYALFSVQDVTDLTHRIQDYLKMRDQASAELEERIKAESRLQQQKQVLTGLLESLTARIALLDSSGVIVDCNRAWTEFARENVINQMEVGSNYLACLKATVADPVLGQNLVEGLTAVLEGHLARYEEEYPFRTGSGENWYIMSVTPLVDGLGGGVVSHIDITTRKQAEKKIEHLALHDTLTGIPNRLLFSDRCSQALARAKRYGKSVALLYADLDDFKTINDRYGHSAGDTVLRTVARRLALCVRESDTVARLGGDEFVLLLADITDTQDASRVARKVVHSMARAIKFEGNPIQAKISIGISIYPKDGNSMLPLLNAADAAMYRVKAGGKNRYQFYSEP